MRHAGWRTWLGAGVGALLLTACHTSEEEAPPDLDDVAAATVTLEPGHCAGVVVEDGRHILTAAHCLRNEDSRVPLSFLGGRRMDGSAVHVDRGRDIAILRLDAPAPVRPLDVAQALPAPGEPLVFAGRNDRPDKPQQAVLERLGRCPSLPEVPAALFTTIRGRPGDSGAPLVDARMQVVGLVHGGAACRIAAPTAGLAEVVAQLPRRGPALARRAPPPPRQAALPSVGPGVVAPGAARSELGANGAEPHALPTHGDGTMAGKKDKGPQDARPRDIGDDQQAGFHAGENFQPRNRGQVADAQDRGAADASRHLAHEHGDAAPHADTPWEARVERGEEWTSQDVPEREARGDEEPDSAVSRQGLVSPPPEE